MKISNSKKELARIISENGGWRDGEFAAPDADGWIEWKGGECPVGEGDRIDVKFSDGDEFFDVSSYWGWGADAGCCNIIAYRLHKPERVETVEYNYSGVVYTGPVKSEFVVNEKPTLDQLLQDWRNADDFAQRKQEEADETAAMRDERWKELQARAGEMGVTIWRCDRVGEPAQDIADWCDLRVGDEMQCVVPAGGVVVTGSVGVIVEILGEAIYLDFPEQKGYGYSLSHFERGDVKLIRRQ